FSASLCPAATVILGTLLLRAGRRLHEARRAGAVLDTVPLASFCWLAGHKYDREDGPAGRFAGFVAGLAPSPAARPEAARQALQRIGTPFSARFVKQNGGAVLVEGRRAATGEIVLWLVDASATLAAERAREETAGLREMLDTVPMPVWRRAPVPTLPARTPAYVSTTRAAP